MPPPATTSSGAPPEAPPPGTTRIMDLDSAWATPSPGARLRAVRVAAEGLAPRFAAGPRAVSVRTLPLVDLPYPTKFAFFHAALSLAPYVVLTHRCLLVQFLQGGALKTLLFNPTDLPGAATTPYFARLVSGVPARLKNYLSSEAEPWYSEASFTMVNCRSSSRTRVQLLRGKTSP